MDEIIPGLFISSWECAKDQSLLETKNIERIVAIGCDYDFTNSKKFDCIEYLLYPKILDEPESLILHIFDNINEFIDKSMESKKSVLIHCVYGQSRSAACCIAYLIHIGYSPIDAMNCIKNVHPSVCINPGFLCQLYYYSMCGDSSSSASYRLLLRSYNIPLSTNNISTSNNNKIEGEHNSSSNSLNVESSNVVQPMQIKSYLCKSCGQMLFTENDIVTPSANYYSQDFVDQFTDSFWSGYRNHRYNSNNITMLKQIDSNNSYVICPLDWVSEQMKNNVNCYRREGDILCNQCSVVCGSWKRKGLNLIGPHNLCDLIIVHRKSIKVKRILH